MKLHAGCRHAVMSAAVLCMLWRSALAAAVLRMLGAAASTHRRCAVHAVHAGRSDPYPHNYQEYNTTSA